MLIPLFCPKSVIAIYTQQEQVARLLLKNGCMENTIIPTRFSSANVKALVDLFSQAPRQESAEATGIRKFIQRQMPLFESLMEKKGSFPLFPMLRDNAWRENLLDEPFALYFDGGILNRIKPHFSGTLMGGLSTVKIGKSLVCTNSPALLLPREVIYFSTCILPTAIEHWLDFSWDKPENMQQFVQSLFECKVKICV